MHTDRSRDGVGSGRTQGAGQHAFQKETGNGQYLQLKGYDAEVAEPRMPYLNIDSFDGRTGKIGQISMNVQQDDENYHSLGPVPQEPAPTGHPASQSRLDSSSGGGSVSVGVSNKHPSGNIGSAQGVPSSKQYSGSTPPVQTRDTRELQRDRVHDRNVIREDQEREEREQSKSSFFSMEAAEEGEAAQNDFTAADPRAGYTLSVMSDGRYQYGMSCTITTEFHSAQNAAASVLGSSQFLSQWTPAEECLYSRSANTAKSAVARGTLNRIHLGNITREQEKTAAATAVTRAQEEALEERRDAYETAKRVRYGLYKHVTSDLEQRAHPYAPSLGLKLQAEID